MRALLKNYDIMYRIYYKRWIHSTLWIEAHVRVDNVIIPEDNLDIEIKGDSDVIEYLYDIFGGCMSEEYYDSAKRGLLLAKMPEDVLKIKRIEE